MMIDKPNELNVEELKKLIEESRSILAKEKYMRRLVFKKNIGQMTEKVNEINKIMTTLDILSKLVIGEIEKEKID